MSSFYNLALILVERVEATAILIISPGIKGITHIVKAVINVLFVT